MKKRTVRPYELWNPGAVEEWLEHEAANGWYLLRCNGWFATFEKGEPSQHCRVRIQPQGPESQEEFDRRTDVYAEMGWRFTAVAGRNLDVEFEAYYCDDPLAPELDTDPVAYGWVWEKLLKKAWWTGWLTPILTGAVLVAFACMALSKFGTPLQMLLNLNVPLLFAVGILWPMLTAVYARQLVLVYGLRRNMKAGIKPEHSGSWRRSRLWWRVMTWLLLAYWLVYLTANVLDLWRWSGLDTEDAPYVTTSELLPDTRLEDWSFEGYKLDRSVLRPLNFYIRMGDNQQRRIINETQRLRLESLAKACYEEKVAEYRTNWPDLRETDFDAFDDAVLLENGSGLSVLLIRSEKTVYSLWVNFPADLPGRLESLAQDLNRFQESLKA